MDEPEHARRRQLWAEWLEHIEAVEDGFSPTAYHRWIADLSGADRRWLLVEAKRFKDAATRRLAEADAEAPKLH